MSPKFQKRSAYPEGHLRLKFVGRNETKTSKAKRIEVFQPNYPIAIVYWKLSHERSFVEFVPLL